MIGGDEVSNYLFSPELGVRAVSDAADLKKTTISTKPAHPDTDQTLSKFSFTEPLHIRLFIIVALGVFFSEMVVMAVVLFLPLSNWLMMIFDATLLIVLLSPILYFFMFRPLMRNIQERKHAEAVLRESENRFRTVFRTSPDSITISRLEDGRIVDVNDGFSELSRVERFFKDRRPRKIRFGNSTLE
jgi:PAS domain-containing protein